MTTVKDILNYTESFAPLCTAADFDNCGVLVGSKDCTVTKALLALDITKDVVNEAKEKGAELIISHHPVIFNPLKSLNLESVPYLLAKYGITAIKDVLWRADSETVMLAGDGDDCMILVPYHISDGRFDDAYSVPND